MTTVVCFAGCPCDKCEEVRRLHRRASKMRKRGYYQQVDTEPVRERIEWLVAQGMTRQQIGLQSGVGPATVNDVWHRKRTKMYRRNAEAIFRLRPHSGPWVPALGTVRRVRALAALGHEQAEVGRLAGLPNGSLKQIIYQQTTGGRQYIKTETAEAIDAVYRDLCMKVGTNKRTATMAAQKGWPPPLAWDDIDDPDEVPNTGKHHEQEREAGRFVAGSHLQDPEFDEAVVVRFLAGDRTVKTTRADKTEIVRRWVESGRSERALMKQTGWKPGRYSPSQQEEKTA